MFFNNFSDFREIENTSKYIKIFWHMNTVRAIIKFIIPLKFHVVESPVVSTFPKFIFRC